MNIEHSSSPCGVRGGAQRRMLVTLCLFFLLLAALPLVIQADCLCPDPQVTANQTTPQLVGFAVPQITSTLTVSGLEPYLCDLDVTTFITHTAGRDIDMVLISPQGTIITLVTDEGGQDDNVFNGTLWDDDADPDGGLPYSNNNGLASDHNYQNLVVATPLVPEDALSALIGENPNGTWQLVIRDDLVATDGGELIQWSLHFRTLPVAPLTTGSATYSNFTDWILPGPVTQVTSTVTAAALIGEVQKVTVTTYLSHTQANDIDMVLISPQGTTVTLTTDNGAGDDNVFYGTVWDDDADPDGGLPYNNNNGLATDHNYQNMVVAAALVPEEALGAFIGENPNGTWQLVIRDDANPAEFGYLDYWTLNLNLSTCPDLAVTKLADPMEVTANDWITFTMHYTNTGGTPAENVTITDTVDLTALHNVSWTSSGPALTATPGYTYVWTLPYLGPAESGTITVTGQVLAECREAAFYIGNTASITSTSEDRDPSNNDSSVYPVRVASRPPHPTSFALSQPEPCEDTIEYEVVTSLQNGGAYSWSVLFSDGGAASGATTSLHVTGDHALADPSFAGILSATVTLTDSHNCVVSGVSNDLDVNQPPEITSLVMVQLDPYVAQVAISGTFTDPDGDNMGFFVLDSEGSAWSGSNTTGFMWDDTLSDPDFCDMLTAVLSVSDSLGCTVVGQTQFYVCALNPVEVDKWDLLDPVPATWHNNYTIRVTNLWDQPLINVLVTDTLPLGMYFVSATPPAVHAAGSPTVTWTIASIPATSYVDLTLRVGTNSYVRGVLNNTVCAQYDGRTVVCASEGTTIVTPPPAPTATPTSVLGVWTCPRTGYIGSPHGVPDFDQRQEGAGVALRSLAAVGSGPAALADALWYLDAQAETVMGAPFDLISAFGAWGQHAPQNVPALVGVLAGDLQADATGVSLEEAQSGLAQYFAAQGVFGAIEVQTIANPSVAWLKNTALTNDGIPVVLLGFYQQQNGVTVRTGGHWAAVNCVNPAANVLQFSDPWFDRAANGFPGEAFGGVPASPVAHNDTANASYDAYQLGGNGGGFIPLGYGGTDLGELAAASAGANFAAALEGLRGEHDPALPVNVKADYALFLRPISGYPIVATTETPEVTPTATTTLQPGATPTATGTATSTLQPSVTPSPTPTPGGGTPGATPTATTTATLQPGMTLTPTATPFGGATPGATATLAATMTPLPTVEPRYRLYLPDVHR